MSKRVFINFWNGLLYGLQFFAAVCIVSIVANTDIGIGNRVAYTLMLISLIFIVRFMTERDKSFDTKDECKKHYSDVSGFRRRHIVVLGVAFIALLFAAVYVGFYRENSLDTDYPDAACVIKEEFGVTDSRISLYRSLPVYVSENVWSVGQLIHDATELEDSANGDVVDSELSELLSQYDSAVKKLKNKAILDVVLFLVCGITYYVSLRTMRYHSTMREIERKEVA